MLQPVPVVAATVVTALLVLAVDVEAAATPAAAGAVKDGVVVEDLEAHRGRWPSDTGLQPPLTASTIMPLAANSVTPAAES